jgi:hypothetical protein
MQKSNKRVPVALRVCVAVLDLETVWIAHLSRHSLRRRFVLLGSVGIISVVVLFKFCERLVGFSDLSVICSSTSTRYDYSIWCFL